MRHQEFRELCVICRELSSSSCLRCGSPLCRRHQHGARDRCETCENEFRETFLAHEIERADTLNAFLDFEHRSRDTPYQWITFAQLAGLWIKSAAKYGAARVFSRRRRRFLAERAPLRRQRGRVATRELDLRGEVCPYTFVRTKLALEEMPLGACLHVTVDHEPATRSVPKSAREWGQEVVSVDPGDRGQWRIILIKRAE